MIVRVNLYPHPFASPSGSHRGQTASELISFFARYFDFNIWVMRGQFWCFIVAKNYGLWVSMRVYGLRERGID
jgi:hypothetical protein